MRAGITVVLLGLTFASNSLAESFVEAGFEGYSVAPGQFVRPSSGVWTFTNDAAVVRPFAPPTYTGSFSTWSATRPAYEGQQYACTYAGADALTQSVSFLQAGTWAISVYAFAPSGQLDFGGGSPPVPLANGQFRFAIDGVDVGPTFTVPAGSDWTEYQTQFAILAGAHSLGIHNPTIGTYFINFDSFSLTAVPEPGCGLAVLGIAALMRRR